MSVPAAKTTSLATLKQDLAPPPIANLPTLNVGFTSLQAFELVQRVGTMFAKSTIVPQRFQNNVANCAIALEMAHRMGASPLMVMQNLYIVHGNPGWAAKFLIACFNQCGRFASVKYQMVGTKGKDDWGCIAYTTELATGERIEGPLITIELAKKEGWYSRKDSKWQTIPEQMLRYRAAAWMINTTAPEISMGLRTAEEIGDVFDAQRAGDGSFTVDMDALRSANPENNGGPVAYDVAAAKQLIANCTTVDQLRNTWDAIAAQCKDAGIEIPLEVEAAASDREAALGQAS
jgi:hypothetical protein